MDPNLWCLIRLGGNPYRFDSGSLINLRYFFSKTNILSPKGLSYWEYVKRRDSLPRGNFGVFIDLVDILNKEFSMIVSFR